MNKAIKTPNKMTIQIHNFSRSELFFKYLTVNYYDWSSLSDRAEPIERPVF